MKNIIISFFALVFWGCTGDSKTSLATEHKSAQTQTTDPSETSRDGLSSTENNANKGKTKNKEQSNVAMNNGQGNSHGEQNGSTEEPTNGQLQTTGNTQNGPEGNGNQRQGGKQSTQTKSGLGDQSGDKKNNSTTYTNAPGTSGVVGGENTLFIGVFAQWNNKGQVFDGSYDTVQSAFLLCSTKEFRVVPRNEVKLREYASCDFVKQSSFQIMRKKTDGSIDPHPTHITINGNQGIIKEGGNTRIIKFDPATIKRIEKVNTAKKAALTTLPPRQILLPQDKTGLVPGAMEQTKNNNLSVTKNVVKTEGLTQPVIKNKNVLVPAGKNIVVPEQIMKKNTESKSSFVPVTKDIVIPPPIVQPKTQPKIIMNAGAKDIVTPDPIVQPKDQSRDFVAPVKKNNTLPGSSVNPNNVLSTDTTPPSIMKRTDKATTLPTFNNPIKKASNLKMDSSKAIKKEAIIFKKQ